MTTTNPTSAERSVESVAAGLTKGAAKACAAMTTDWQFPGKATFSANGAWALYWARGLPKGRGGLAEMEALKDGKARRKAYRLTPLGEAVRAHLTASEKKG